MLTRREAIAAGAAVLLGGSAVAEAAYKAQQDKLRAKMLELWLNKYRPLPIPLSDFRVWRGGNRSGATNYAAIQVVRNTSGEAVRPGDCWPRLTVTPRR